jgi:APA family basic amino acid/polyamine antiporter
VFSFYCICYSENLAPSNSGDGTDLIGIGSAMIPCLWAYDGWSNISYLAEEMIDFETRLPKAIVGGVSCVMVCYLLANVSYLAVLSVDKFEDSDAIAVDFGSKIGGHDVTLAGIFAAGVALSTAGAAHGSIMTGGRAFYSVARNKMAPAQMAKLNSRGAPYVALLAQSAWTLILLALPGSSFSSLLDYSGSASWIFYALVGSIVIRLRITQPDIERPFKVPLYPLPPLLLCALSLFLITSSLLQSPLYTCLGLGLVAVSYPVWLIKCRFWGDGDDDDSSDDMLDSVAEPLIS